MDAQILHHYVEEFEAKRPVNAEDTEALFDALRGSEDGIIVARLLSAWNDKGVSEEELFAFASIMRSRMRRIDSRHASCVDIVGTGGSKAKSFNVSTAAAFVIAGAGIPVAKHGNRAATSSSGSADVLSMLGIDVDLDPEIAENNLNEHGLCFMFAPRFHSLSATLAKARRSLGKPSIFNNLGPLCNPASAQHQVIGVAQRNMLEITARVIARLGTERSWIVHNEKGLDEIGLSGRTHVAEVEGDRVKYFEITADDFGVAAGGTGMPENCDAHESASIIRAIFANDRRDDATEMIVLMNAAAAIYVSGSSASLLDADEVAKASVRNGMALEKLKALSEPQN